MFCPLWIIDLSVSWSSLAAYNVMHYTNKVLYYILKVPWAEKAFTLRLGIWTEQELSHHACHSVRIPGLRNIHYCMHAWPLGDLRLLNVLAIKTVLRFLSYNYDQVVR